MQLLFTINGVPVMEEEDGSYTFLAGAMIDDDGSGPSLGDPDYQPQTTYRSYLDATVDQYIVLPPQLFEAVRPIVLGCQAFVLNALTGLYCDAVVGDVGPRSKIGEISVATAKAIGVPPSPITGGLSDKVILYRVFPGVPAVIGRSHYQLEPYSG